MSTPAGRDEDDSNAVSGPRGPLVRCICDDSAALPLYASESAAGADLSAFLDGPVVIQPGERRKIGTGLQMEIPAGYEGQVRPRSGLALRHGITLLNSPGTIDSDYRGEVSLVLVNLGQEPFEVTPGMRIGQIVISPVVRARFARAASLDPTARGETGFGSTGQ